MIKTRATTCPIAHHRAALHSGGPSLRTDDLIGVVLQALSMVDTSKIGMRALTVMASRTFATLLYRAVLVDRSFDVVTAVWDSHLKDLRRVLLFVSFEVEMYRSSSVL